MLPRKKDSVKTERLKMFKREREEKKKRERERR